MSIQNFANQLPYTYTTGEFHGPIENSRSPFNHAEQVFEIFRLPSIQSPIEPYVHVTGLPETPLIVSQSDELRDVSYSINQDDIGEDTGVAYVYNPGQIDPPMGHIFVPEEDSTFDYEITDTGQVVIRKINRIPFHPVAIKLRRLKEWAISSPGCHLYRGLKHPYTSQYLGWTSDDINRNSENRNRVLKSSTQLRDLYTDSLVRLGLYPKLTAQNYIDRAESTHEILRIISNFREWQSKAMKRATQEIIPGEEFGVRYTSGYPYLEWASTHIGPFGCSDNMAANVLADFLESLGVKCDVKRFDNLPIDDRNVAWKTQKSRTSDKVVIYLPDGRVAYVDPFEGSVDQSTLDSNDLRILKNSFVSKFAKSKNIDIDELKLWSLVDSMNGKKPDMIYGLSVYENLRSNYRHIYSVIAGLALDPRRTVEEVQETINRCTQLPGLPRFYSYARRFESFRDMIINLARNWFSNRNSGIGEFGVRDLFDEQSQMDITYFMKEKIGSRVTIDEIPQILVLYFELSRPFDHRDLARSKSENTSKKLEKLYSFIGRN